MVNSSDRRPIASLDREAAARMWSAYAAAHPESAMLGSDYVVHTFGDHGALADELLALVISGRKRGTAQLLSEYVADGEDLPRIGSHLISCDSSGVPRVILRTTSIRLAPFRDAEASFARAEGEDDGSLERWRIEHRRYFTRLRQARGETFSESDEVTYEQFAVVWPPELVETNRLPLFTDRIEIDVLTAADVPAFVAYRQDPDVARYQSWDVDYDEQRAHRLVEGQNSLVGGDGLPAAGDWVQLAVRDKQSRELFGDVAVHRLDDQPHTYEIGFTLAPAAQGRGLAAEAIRRVLDHLFRSAGAHRVTASCDTRNEASRRVLGRSGFNQEAHHVDADFFKGEWTTLDEFALLASEYETIADIGGPATSAGCP